MSRRLTAVAALLTAVTGIFGTAASSGRVAGTIGKGNAEDLLA